jgi:hypothetical protein
MENEYFKIIEAYPAYRISNYGRIQSRWKMGGHYNGFITKDVWKNKKYHVGEDGYPKVCLADGYNKPKTFTIHKLMAMVFLGERDSNDIIRHLDGNRLNNSLDNLSYGTYTDNENDKILHGTWNTRNGGAKLTPLQVEEIRKKIKIGYRDNDLAIEYNVSRPTITRIRNYKIWK